VVQIDDAPAHKRHLPLEPRSKQSQHLGSITLTLALALTPKLTSSVVVLGMECSGAAACLFIGRNRPDKSMCWSYS
jgi:hypothetical protein